MPVVSVIIPTFKRPSYLRQAIDSVLSQSFQDFEIIVVDDGSPGDENEIICLNTPKCKYIKIPNSGGPSHPRNIGIQAAKGKYLAFLDDDDLFFSDKLKIQVSVLDANPNYGIIHGYIILIDEKGDFLNKISGKPGSPNVKHGNVVPRMIGNFTLMTSTVVMRRDLIDQVGLFNEQMPPAGEDVEFWTRCAFYTDFYYLDKPLVLYRVHNYAISKNINNYKDLSLHIWKALLELKQGGNRRALENWHVIVDNISISLIKNNPKSISTIKRLWKINPLNFIKFKVYKFWLKKIIT